MGQALPLDIRFFLRGGSTGSEEPSPGATLNFLLYNRPEEIVITIIIIIMIIMIIIIIQYSP